MVLPATGAEVDDVELPPSEPSLRLGGLGESAEAKSCASEALGPGGVGTTLLGLGPGLRRAKTIQSNIASQLMLLLTDTIHSDVSRHVTQRIQRGRSG